MGSLAILVYTSPEQTAHARFAVELARAATAKGHQVAVFGIGDGVLQAKAGHFSEHADATPIALELSRLLDDTRATGALSVAVCGLSREERGLTAADLIAGGQSSSTSKFGTILKQADRCLTLVP